MREEVVPKPERNKKAPVRHREQRRCVSHDVSETIKGRFEWKLERNILRQRFPDELSRDKAKRRASGI